MKAVEENNFMKYVEEYRDGKPLYDYLSFDRIAGWSRENRHYKTAFGRYGFAVVRTASSGFEKRLGTIWIGAEGTCMAYNGILYEDEADFEKLILKLEQERVSDMLGRM